MRAFLFAGLVAAAAPQSIASHPLVSIMDIQGRGHTSPLAGDTVVTTGVVTVVARNGFFVQDPTGDADPATSDALFVFTSTAPDVLPGDLVSLEGAIDEYRQGDDSQYLTVTEMNRPAVTSLSHDNPLPDPVHIGRDGRVPPSEVIDDDALTRFDPERDGLDFYESVESMRVIVRDAVAVSVTNRYGEVWVLGDAGNVATGANKQGGITISSRDFNPERIQLDDTYLSGSFRLVEVGDGLGDVMGVVGYQFGNFEILPSSMPQVQRTIGTREITALRAGATDLTIASFNVENFNRSNDARIAALAEIIVTHLRAPDVLVLEEIQDDSGVTNDGTVGAAETYGALITAVKARSGPDFEFRDIAPENGRDGGVPGGNIRAGILFQPGRVTFIDRGVASATDATEVIDTGSGPALSFSPGRVEPQAAAWQYSRKPLTAEMVFAGEHFFLIACHFSSRSGSSPLFGAVQPPIEERRDKRIAQAGLVRRFVDQLLDVDPDARVIVIGDFNDFQFSETLETLAGGLVNLTNQLLATEQYTYNFEGNSQALDHILVSPTLAAYALYDVVHVCADFAESVSDHDPILARVSFSSPVVAAAPSIPLRAKPNPFTTATEVSCVATVGDGPVEAVVYDVAGHRLRTVLLQRSADGLHEGTWDGRDDRGRRVPAGVYLMHVANQHRRFTTKLVRLK